VRVILDTNVLISAIFAEFSLPGRVLKAWYGRKFTLLSSLEQIEEVKRVSRYPHLVPRLSSARAGRLVNDLRDAATVVANLPSLDVSSDPFDNYLLAMVDGGRADYLVTGDKGDLLALGKHGTAKIVSVREFAEILGS
jgi:putative PIN family toxin of toxin-antitoxin system